MPWIHAWRRCVLATKRPRYQGTGQPVTSLMHAWYPGPMAPVVAMIRGGMVMGIQKHRRSKMSGATRRAHWKLRGATLVNCPKCHSPMRAHRVCPTCGTYAGRDVMKIEAAEEK